MRWHWAFTLLILYYTEIVTQARGQRQGADIDIYALKPYGVVYFFAVVPYALI
jgi:hypothetical protein